jgi:CYTH domain-containing protein
MELIFSKRFLLTDLPEPLVRASEHLQFFDNHVTGTRLFLRRIRDPKSREWTRILVQEYPNASNDFSQLARTEIYLTEYEYETLAVFEGNELRYNRYFYEFEGLRWEIDMYLNRELWNLILAAVNFASEVEMQSFAPPSFAVREITNNEIFTPARLVDLTIEEIRQKLASSEDI